MRQRYLNPQNDVAFKRLFGTEKNKNILLQMLNSVLVDQLAKPVTSIAFLPTYQDPEVTYKKQSIVDVLCQDQAGNQYIIEMQVAKTKGFQERAQLYAAKAFGGQMDKGGRYENLKEVIFLAFTAFVLFPQEKDYKTNHRHRCDESNECYLDKMRFTFVELPKFAAKCTKLLEALSLEEKFYHFLHHAQDCTAQERQALVGKDGVIREAYQALERCYWTVEELRYYDDVEKTIRDNLAANEQRLEDAEQRGMKRGMEKGIEKGILQTAQKMLTQGLSSSLVQTVTGLSQQKVTALQE